MAECKKINVIVKTPKEKKTIECDENADIKEVSEQNRNFLLGLQFCGRISCFSLASRDHLSDYKQFLIVTSFSLRFGLFCLLEVTSLPLQQTPG